MPRTSPHADAPSSPQLRRMIYWWEEVDTVAFRPSPASTVDEQ